MNSISHLSYIPVLFNVNRHVRPLSSCRLLAVWQRSFSRLTPVLSAQFNSNIAIQSDKKLFNRWWKDDSITHFKPAYLLAMNVLQSYLFTEREMILDIGCAGGEITKYIAKEKVPLGSVIGIDASQAMIRAAHFSKVPNCRFKHGLAESFSLEQQFDLVVSFSALHWVPDQAAVWRNIHKHLKTGGIALVSLNPHPRCSHLVEAINEVCDLPLFKPCFRNFIEKKIMPAMMLEDYKKLILNCGLSIEQSMQTFRYFDYENKSDFTQHLRAWLPHIVMLSDTQQDLFIELTVRAYLKRSNQENGKIKLKYNNFIIKAKKIGA